VLHLWAFCKAFIRHRLKNIRENKCFAYTTVLLEKGYWDPNHSDIHIGLLSIFGETE
jgi:hypothetical protein